MTDYVSCPPQHFALGDELRFVITYDTAAQGTLGTNLFGNGVSCFFRRYENAVRFYSVDSSSGYHSVGANGWAVPTACNEGESFLRFGANDWDGPEIEGFKPSNWELNFGLAPTCIDQPSPSLPMDPFDSVKCLPFDGGSPWSISFNFVRPGTDGAVLTS